jgi:lysophospholipase L1-like esterase
MKYLLLILLLFTFISSFSQTPPKIVNRSSSAVTISDARLRAQLNFYLPHTNGLTLNSGLDLLGATIYDDSSQAIWYRDTIITGGHKWTQLSIDYFSKPVPFNSTSLFIGNSITYGYNELGGTLKSWPAYLKDYLNLSSITNLAISGSGARRGYKQLSENLNPLSVGPLGTMVGFNNVRGTTDTAHVFELVRASHRAMAALLFSNPASMNFYIMGNSGSVNPNISTSQTCGSCTAGSEATLQDYGSRTYYYRHNDLANTSSNWWLKSSLVANETVTISNVEGPGIVVGTWAATTGWSRIEVRVDGTLKTTYNPNNRVGTYWADGFTTNGITNDAIVVLGLRDTLHTVELKFLDGSATGGFDYVAGMKSQMTCLSTPMYVLDLPHMNSVGYNYPGGEVTEAQLDSCSVSRFRDLQAYFPGYPIARVNENATGYYNPNDPTQIQNDGIHPLSLGQWNIARAVIDAMGQKWLNTGLGGSSLDATLAIGNTSARRLLLTGNNTTNTNMEVADLVFQSYANSNSWVGSNIYFDGSNFRYKHNGPASMLYFNSGYTEYKIAASGTGGNIATLITVSTIAPDGSIFQGGSITSSLTGAGAKLFIDGSTGNIKSPNVLAFGPTSYNLGLPNMIWASGTQPGYTFYNSAGGTNQKVWDLTAGATTFSLRMGNDAYNLTTDVLTATRTDYTHADVNFGAGAVRIKDSLKIDNTPTGNVSDSILVKRNNVVYAISPSLNISGIDWVNVVSFGADSTGVTNSTTAIQNAFNSLGAGRSKVVYFPSGTYLTSGNIHVPSCRIIGVSGTNAMGFDAPQGNRTFKFDGTKILCTSATNNLFIFDSSGTIIEYCSLINTSVTTPSAGAGIKSMKPSTKILHCAVSGFYDNVWFDESPEYLVDDVFFSQYVRYGIYHRTFIEPDAGDQVITNSWFYPRNHVTMAGIHVESGGGLKLSNLKFNTNSTDTLPTNCVEVVLDNQTTSDLLVTNSSFENYTGKGISVKTINGGAFFHVVVNGNQFAPNSSNADAVFIDGSGGTIRDVAITGNAFGNADTAVYLNTVSSPSIIGNVFDVVNADIVRVNTSEFVELNYTKPSVNPDQINIRRSNAAPIYNTLANISSSAFASAGYRLRNSSSETAEFGFGSNGFNGSSAYIKTSATGSHINFSPESTESLWINKDTIRISAPYGLLLRNGSETSSFQNIQGSIQTSANAHYNGSTWERFNTSLPSWNLNVDPNSNAFAVRNTAAGSGSITWTERFKVDNSGVVTIARMQLAGVTASPSTAPIKLAAGTLMTSPENGAIEFDGNSFYGTAAGTRMSFGGGTTRIHVSTISTNTTITTDENLMKIDASGGNVTITLPAASNGYNSTLSTGITYTFQRIDNSGNTVTIQRAGSDVINGGTSFTLTTQWETKHLTATSNTTWSQY